MSAASLNKSLKIILAGVAPVALVITLVVPAQADVELSANVALVSDYRFRGISQSDEDFAVQGGFDAAFEQGFYIGTWGSSVDFDSNGAADGSLELDYYAGWAGNLGDSDVGLDVGAIYYDYPGDSGGFGDYWELYASVSLSDFSLGVAYSDDYYGETDEFWYLSGDYSMALSDEFSLSFHLGYNMLEENGGFLATDTDDYTDYSVTLSYAWSGIDFSVAYVGTDLDEEDVFDTDWADDTIVFSIAKSM